MLELKNITYNYDGKPLLENFNLKIEKKLLTALLGSSGCGKTTILRLIAGLETPRLGDILIDEQTVSSASRIIVPPHQRNLGFIFQDLALWPHFTIYKNLAFGLEVRKVKDIKNKVLDMLDFFGLSVFASKYPHQLSGGQQQLTAIARALVLEPEILLMDEPLANLDVKLKRRIPDFILKMKNNFDLTVVYVSHDHREVFSLANEIVVINDGKIEDKGTKEHLLNSNNEFVKYFLEF
jgi:ABC-type Fe3+/spermidine/putrescine transport system ATPase subunit